MVTGGTGLVGSGLVRTLSESEPDRQFALLCRHPETIQRRSNVFGIQGDLCRPKLGVDPDKLATLQKCVTSVIHCAANLSFTSSLESARRTNVEGTSRILDFARNCSRIEKVAHLSTLYIVGRRPGTLFEEPLCHGDGYFNSYEQSKHEAEQLVFERMRDLPICVYRLSSLIGHSETGKVSQQNYFHRLVRLLHRAHEVDGLPVDPEAPVDLVPDDWCINALTLLYQRHFVPGRIQQICAGPVRSLKAGQLIDLVFDVYSRVTGRSALPLSMVQRPRLRDGGEESGILPKGPLSGLLEKFLPHLAVRQPFDCGITGPAIAKEQIVLPPIADFIERVVRYSITAA